MREVKIERLNCQYLCRTNFLLAASSAYSRYRCLALNKQYRIACVYG